MRNDSDVASRRVRAQNDRSSSLEVVGFDLLNVCELRLNVEASNGGNFLSLFLLDLAYLSIAVIAIVRRVVEHTGVLAHGDGGHRNGSHASVIGWRHHAQIRQASPPTIRAIACAGLTFKIDPCYELAMALSFVFILITLIVSIDAKLIR